MVLNQISFKIPCSRIRFKKRHEVGTRGIISPILKNINPIYIMSRFPNSVLILSAYLWFSVVSLHRVLSTKTVHAFLISPRCATYTAHLILSHFNCLTVLNTACTVWSPVLCNYLKPSVIFPFFRLQTFLIAPRSLTPFIPVCFFN